MWVRKCFADEEKPIQSPIPTEIFSNEEFIPPPQSPQQQRWEARIGEMAISVQRNSGCRDAVSPEHRGYGRCDAGLQRGLREDL